jgi:hypothetical protein
VGTITFWIYRSFGRSFLLPLPITIAEAGKPHFGEKTITIKTS